MEHYGSRFAESQLLVYSAGQEIPDFYEACLHMNLS